MDIERKPNSDPAKDPLGIGIEHIAGSRYQEAIKILSQHENDVWCLHYLGLAYTYTGELDNAMERFRKLTTMEWTDMHYENNPHFYIGAIFFIKGSYRQAVNSLVKAKEKVPISDLVNDARLFRWLGVSRQFEGDILGAIGEYCTAIVFQQRQRIPVINSSDCILLNACLRGSPKCLVDFDVRPFNLDLKAEVFEAERLKGGE